MHMINLTFICAAAGAALTFPAPDAKAALLTLRNNAELGGYLCVEVAGGSLSVPTPVRIWDCNGAGHQQFEYNGFYIYAMAHQRCLNVNSITAGSLVFATACTGLGTGAEWFFKGGEIQSAYSSVFPGGPYCLDAGSGAKGTQLRLKHCVEAVNGDEKWGLR